jgi:hypothetical protein
MTNVKTQMPNEVQMSNVEEERIDKQRNLGLNFVI